MGSLRNAHIGLAVGIVVLFGGGFIFRNAGDGAMQIIAFVTLFVTFGVYHFLDERERRAEKARRAQRDLPQTHIH